jgi:uncharacterized protein YlxW (UPF0749 family)
VTAPTARPQPTEASSLLEDLLRNPLEPGYADAAARRRRFGPRTGWRAGIAGAAHLVAMVLIGFLLVVAYQRVVADLPETSRVRADLRADLRQRQADADALQRRADTLRDEVAREGDAALAGEDDAATLRTMAAGAGLGRVTGDGAVVELRDAPAQVDPVTGQAAEDNPGRVLDRDLQDITNALWRLGAEAIAINGQRLTAVTTIRAAGGAILVDYRPVTSPYQITAIGPGNLASRFGDSATARRFNRYVKVYRMRFSVQRREHLTLATAAEPRLRYAHPPVPSGSATPSGATPTPTPTPSPTSARTTGPGGSPVRSGTGGG